jgi:hypothetical protein
VTVGVTSSFEIYTEMLRTSAFSSKMARYAIARAVESDNLFNYFGVVSDQRAGAGRGVNVGAGVKVGIGVKGTRGAFAAGVGVVTTGVGVEQAVTKRAAAARRHSGARRRISRPGRSRGRHRGRCRRC